MRLAPPPEETIALVSRQIAEGQRSCVSVLDECLGRINAREEEVRAWVVLDEEGARSQARALDAELAQKHTRGPLHGIPIGIKDIFDVAGLPTAAGSRLWAGRTASADAVLVARLRQAGAVILGKTVTTQYACFDPPITRNPWNLARTPGGSSSGSAAGLACGMFLGALGSQTGGSITRPASFCGVAGLKPTHGRLSLEGILPLAPSMDHPGPMARNVSDLSVMWEALISADTRKDSPGSSPYTALGRPPRLGKLGGLFFERASPEMRSALDRVIDALAGRGAAIVAPPLPASFDDVLAHHLTVMSSEAAAWHEERFRAHPDDYLPRITALIEQGVATPATQYVRTRQHQEQLKRDIVACFEGLDALITPATTGPAPDRSTTGDPCFNSPWSYTGLPTISFPIALSSDGLPLAIQLVGRPRGEFALFQTALWCEEALCSL
jgi:Asp-tRNA(Asn)/Glu-tRNA(Gln) amidotransferase A subunit family amidase